MPDFTQAKVYAIKCLTTNKQYVGSTTKPLHIRLIEHLSSYQCHKLRNTSHYYSSFEVIKNKNCQIVLLEEWPCTCIEELRRREQLYIINMDCVNKKIPNRTTKDFFRENPDYLKRYYYNNKDHDRYKKRIPCACGGVYTLHNKHKHMNTQMHQIYNLSNNNIDVISPPEISQPSPFTPSGMYQESL
jgi:hypothetical protein